MKLRINELSDNEMQRAKLLLEFLEITKVGMTKPYDPTQILGKIQQFEDDYNKDHELMEKLDLSHLKDCCMKTAVIQDAKDFKPFIMAAVEQFADLLSLEVKYNNRRNYGDRH